MTTNRHFLATGLTDTTEFSASDCGICLQSQQTSSLSQPVTIRPCPCKLSFHSDCIREWFLEHKTCPSCRQIVFFENLKEVRSSGAWTRRFFRMPADFPKSDELVEFACSDMAGLGIYQNPENAPARVEIGLVAPLLWDQCNSAFEKRIFSGRPYSNQDYENMARFVGAMYRELQRRLDGLSTDVQTLRAVLFVVMLSEAVQRESESELSIIEAARLSSPAVGLARCLQEIVSDLLMASRMIAVYRVHFRPGSG